MGGGVGGWVGGRLSDSDVAPKQLNKTNHWTFYADKHVNLLARRV